MILATYIRLCRAEWVRLQGLASSFRLYSFTVKFSFTCSFSGLSFSGFICIS